MNKNLPQTFFKNISVILFIAMSLSAFHVVYGAEKEVKDDLKKQLSNTPLKPDVSAIEDDEALYQHGLRHLKGLEDNSSNSEGIKLLQLAADRDHSGALYDLALIMYEGNIVERNYPLAARLFEKVTGPDSVPAQYTLGIIHEHKCLENEAEYLGPEESNNLAAKLYTKAMGSKFCNILNSETPEQESGEFGDDFDDFRKEAAFRLANIYVEDGNPDLIPCAFRLYRSLAAGGHARSQYLLGKQLYNCGNDISSNLAHSLAFSTRYTITMSFSDAAKWLRLAAEQDDMDAQFLLGLMHELGHGVPMLHSEITKWYGKAEAQGHEGAAKRLGEYNQSK